MQQIIIDYKVFAFSAYDKESFEKEAMRLFSLGYTLTSDVKTTSGSAGGFFSSSQNPGLYQAFIKYGTAEEKAEFDRVEAEKAEARRVKMEKANNEFSWFYAVWAVVLITAWILIWSGYL